jgi:hypothetical protein
MSRIHLKNLSCLCKNTWKEEKHAISNHAASHHSCCSGDSHLWKHCRICCDTGTERCAGNFIWPSDGTVIHGGKFWVRMGLRNMGVAPKGTNLPNVGHHHLLIDTELPPMTEPIPSDRNHLHFGAGETEARIELPPGKHTLQLLLGDNNHIPNDPPVYAKKITVIVK